MSSITVPRSRFRWAEFAEAITTFAVTHGLEEAFPVVQDGVAVFWQDHDELTREDGQPVEAVPGDAMSRLRAGFDLFAAFTMSQASQRLDCADGSPIDIPDLDGDEASPPLADDQRGLGEMTECDEAKSYGYLISLTSGRLTLQPALMAESNGECYVEAVVTASLATEPMSRVRPQVHAAELTYVKRTTAAMLRLYRTSRRPYFGQRHSPHIPWHSLTAIGSNGRANRWS